MTETVDAKKTGYIVLRQEEDGLRWIAVDEPIAVPHAEAAIRQVAAANKPGTYVAVPARSWKPVTVKTETKTVLTLT